MKKDFVMPILVLMLICLISSAVLAATNSLTAPIITIAKQERAAAARYEIIPDAEEFVPLELGDLPSSVTEAYSTTNNVGYIFSVTASGYGGDIRIMCGISEDGNLIACKTLEHTETKGIGTRIVEEGEFSDNLVGKDSRLEGVSAVTGATISSNAYLAGIRDAFKAYELVRAPVKGGGV